MKLTYRREDDRNGGHFVVILEFSDKGERKGTVIGVIERDGPYAWRWRCGPPEVPMRIGAGFWRWAQGEPIERCKLADVKNELEARLYIALVGSRDGGTAFAGNAP